MRPLSEYKLRFINHQYPVLSLLYAVMAGGENALYCDYTNDFVKQYLFADPDKPTDAEAAKARALGNALGGVFKKRDEMLLKPPAEQDVIVPSSEDWDQMAVLKTELTQFVEDSAASSRLRSPCGSGGGSGHEENDMYSSVHDALRAVSGTLSADLVPEAALRGMVAFAGHYPELGQAQYIECRLGERASPQVNLLVSATTFDRRKLGQALAGRPDGAAGLLPFKRLVERWNAPASAIHHRVPLVWLEFDHMERDQEPTGNVCVCLAPAYLNPFAALPAQSASEVLAVVHESIHVVSGTDATPDERARLSRCFERLPVGARFIHLSVMIGRGPRQLKLYGVFPQAALLAYLAEVGWAGDRAAIGNLLARLCPPARTGGSLYVDLPLTDMGAPDAAGLGLAFGQQHLRVASEHDHARRALLEALIEDGLCTVAQREALCAWPGREGPLERWMDVKIVHRPSALASASTLAKAYLGFGARLTGAPAVRRAAGAPGARGASPAPLATLRTT